MFAVMKISFFRKVFIALFGKNRSVIAVLFKDMAMKSLDRQLKIETLMMVYVEICVRANIFIYGTKTTGIDKQNLAVTEVIMFHVVRVI